MPRMTFAHKREFPLDQRIAESTRVRERYTDRVPVGRCLLLRPSPGYLVHPLTSEFSPRTTATHEERLRQCRDKHVAAHGTADTAHLASQRQ